MKSLTSGQWRIAIDIGGTFTDLELLHPDSGRRLSHKTPTTPDDPSTGLINGISQICDLAQIKPSDISGLMHGTTIATNAILQQRFPPAALITTAGFTDVLEIGRHVRTDVYSQVAEFKPNPIARRHRYGVTERIGASGEVQQALDQSSLDDIIDRIVADDINVIAICLLHAYANPAHEQLVAARLRDRLGDCYLSVSSEISPEAREYERTATTVLNSLLMPVVRDYIDHLTARFAELNWSFPVYLVQSNGGVTTPDIAGEQPVRLVLSGPSGGVRAAEVLSERLEQPNLVAIDMGGTSFDVSIIRGGRAQRRTDGKVGVMPVRVPMLEMHTIGAGGGSIAAVDESNRLTVGPLSAGADPGPAAYGHGGDSPTVTDANIVLGRIDPQRFLGGQMQLDVDAAQRALQNCVAKPLALDVNDAAEGVIRIAVSHMASAIRLSLFEKGLDPRDFALISFGGAAGLHATLVAEELGSSRVYFPTQCGTLSAWGMLHADIAHDLSLTRVCKATAAAVTTLQSTVNSLVSQGNELLDRSAADKDNRFHELSVDMRYPGQGWELAIPLTLDRGNIDSEAVDKLSTDFHRRHHEQFAHSDVAVTPELVTVRNRAVGVLDRPRSESLSPSTSAHMPVKRPVYWRGQSRAFDVVERATIEPGRQYSGVIIEETHSTIVIAPDWSASANSDGTITASYRDT